MASLARPEPPSPVVSSSSTLWATASKEWVIPAKPKPGRKPKKDTVTAPVDDEEGPDSKGRRIQNRAAQRAFRERKQSQLAELQSRIQMYEQGEIERNVALQAAAKRLKEENDNLRKENSILQDKVAQYERERDSQKEVVNKRWREDSLTMDVYPQHPVRKRARLASDTVSTVPSPSATFPNGFTPSPPSLVSSPGSNEASEKSFSPIPMQSPYPGDNYPAHASPLDNMFDFQTSPKGTVVFNGPATMEAFDCGFCNDGSACVCRELAIQQSPDGLVVHADSPFKIETVAHATAEVVINVPHRPSILDNLPAYQPPVPLRRRAGNPSAKSLFPVSAVPATAIRPAPSSRTDCSGDPSNCLACADDIFGKAFCAAIGESVATCDDCPSRRLDGTRMCADAESGKACCGIPGFCNGAPARSHPASFVPPPPEPTSPIDSETIPTNEAWRRLKSHPNVAFTDLALLADVVARRSKCTGPTVVISPAPGSITPERSLSPDNIDTSQIEAMSVEDDQGVMLSDPHAHYRMKQEERSARSLSPPRLVPQEELMKCSRTRVLREVHTSGVRDALRLLDARFAQS